MVDRNDIDLILKVMMLGKSDIFDAKCQIFAIFRSQKQIKLNIVATWAQKQSIFTASKMDPQLLHQKVRQRISVMNILVFLLSSRQNVN